MSLRLRSTPGSERHMLGQSTTDVRFGLHRQSRKPGPLKTVPDFIEANKQCPASYF